MKMPSAWRPSSAELDRVARRELDYEVRMLLEQHAALEVRTREVREGRRSSLGADGQALLEAVLVHLRLLDAFLRGGGGRDDVEARHWVPGWTSRTLGRKQLDRVNVKVAHLAARRATRRTDWKPEELAAPVTRCCRNLSAFFDALEAHDPARAAAFARPRATVAAFLASHPRR